MDLRHAKNVTHHYAGLLGIPPSVGAHGTADAMFAGLDERDSKRRIVAYVEPMRRNSFLTAQQTGQDLLAFADECKRELAVAEPETTGAEPEKEIA